jgi:hypothetical protein
MKVVVFNPAGGPIIAEVTSGQAQPGSYTLRVWEAHANTLVLKERGNFINSDDDAYKLPLPNTRNHERIVESIATAVITPPIKDYALRLSIQQDGKEIGFEESVGKASSATVTADLFVMLEAAP